MGRPSFDRRVRMLAQRDWTDRERRVVWRGLTGRFALAIEPLLGIAFMVGEAFMPTFGILGVGGVTAFVVGATMLFDTSGGGLGLSWVVILGATIVIATGICVIWDERRSVDLPMNPASPPP